MKEASRSISPTAHYTGHVWYRNGMSYKEFYTSEGELFYKLLAPVQGLIRWAMGASLEEFLLQRHAIIDYILEQKIASGEITQIVEVACGLSPRGLRFSEKYPHITYIEADLRGMVHLKQKLLSKRKLPPNHKLIVTDVLLDLGEPSLFGKLLGGMSNSGGVALVSEGLVTYFDRENLSHIWRRFARLLGGFAPAFYVTDINPRDLNDGNLLSTLFRQALGVFVNRQISFPFHSAADARGMLLLAGFSDVKVHDPTELHDKIKMPQTSNSPVRLLEASI